MTLLIVALVAGILLGLNNHVLVIIPVTLGAAIPIGTAAMLDGHGVLTTLLTLVVPAIALQGGYIIGVTGREPIYQFLARFSAGQSNRI